MSFVAALALFVGVLVVAPYLAHRLRRKRADDRPFAAAHLVPPAPPRARRRSSLEDRALFATRALSVLALALLGASPLVRCSRLSLSRSSGASVALAIVLDDSMSMRASAEGDPQRGTSRFERARQGARELLASAREGDAVAIVAAGEPARVALAATTDLRAAQAALDGLAESDRATDLEGAVAMARALVGQLPQVDKRVVVLSDLADGHSDRPPLGEGSDMPVWVALPELRASGNDCALVSADRAGLRVRARVACSQASGAAGREVTLTDGDKVVAKVAAPQTTPGDAVLMLPAEPAGELHAHLTGTDAIASDDVATVMTESGPGAIAVIGDTAAESAATGGAPLIEQALAALKLEIGVRPIPVFPERAEDLAAFVGIVLDDPPGLTPEQRRALGDFMGNGGVVLLALGPRAAVAPLGASLEPVLAHAVRWEAVPPNVAGADPGSARGGLEEASTTLLDLDASRRAVLDLEDVGSLGKLLTWKDGAPLVAERSSGRGEAWVVTLPFSVDSSDLTLRPGFLSLLDVWVERARVHASPRRGGVGVPWVFAGVSHVTIRGPKGPIEVQREGNTWRASPPLIGTYQVAGGDGKHEIRVATPDVRELDFRPRAVAKSALGRDFGDTHAQVDVSWAVALVLLFLTACELGLRVFSSTAAPVEP
ncbi:BatA and WFA domain-containing protein [Pendulispora albinea]|uniref:BatA and WFA domain-containing protein n=1 Tax=Pendulispora albinea TaxID=2741071 RepID=A0ABZ2M3N8_9BACT